MHRKVRSTFWLFDLFHISPYKIPHPIKSPYFGNAFISISNPTFQNLTKVLEHLQEAHLGGTTLGPF